VRAEELGALCQRATDVGPAAYARTFRDGGSYWPITEDSGARALLERNVEPMLIFMPVKLATLAAAHLGSIGTLLIAGAKVGIAPLGRTVVEACSKVSWLLDDTVTVDVRLRRGWLLWAIAEGEGAGTAARDAGRTGAMWGSAQRLQDIEDAITRELGLGLVRPSPKSHPRHWRLDGVELPGSGQLIELAIEQWFTGADAKVFYSQTSRGAHSDILVALAYVDSMLHISEGEGIDFLGAVLPFWALAWMAVLRYVGTTDPSSFTSWRDEMLTAVSRGDLIK
jgi:hypothetical protein